jgi:hypothetical protein
MEIFKAFFKKLEKFFKNQYRNAIYKEVTTESMAEELFHPICSFFTHCSPHKASLAVICIKTHRGNFYCCEKHDVRTNSIPAKWVINHLKTRYGIKEENYKIIVLPKQDKDWGCQND